MSEFLSDSNFSLSTKLPTGNMQWRIKPIQKIATEYGLELSTRAMNVLASYGIRTVEDLAQVDMREVALQVGAGTKTLSEIRSAREKLHNQGIGASESQEGKLPPLSRRAREVLFQLGLEETNDLSSLTMDEIMAIPGTGPKTVLEVLTLKYSRPFEIQVLDWSKTEKLYIFELILRSLSSRACSMLDKLGIRDFESFVAMNPLHVLTSDSSGKKTFDEVSELQMRIRSLFSANPRASADLVLGQVWVIPERIDASSPNPD